MQLTRRKLARNMAAAALATAAIPNAGAQDAAPDAPRQAAQVRMRIASRAMAQVNLPMETQPAFHFAPRT